MIFSYKLFRAVIIGCYFYIISFSGFASTDSISLVLSSGTIGTPYYNTASEISKLLNSSFKSTKINPIASQGTLENLERLYERSADLAIVQRDAAVEAYYGRQKTFKNWEVILPLFPEALQIFVHGEKKIISIKDFTKLLDEGLIKSFAIGPSNSTSHTTTVKVFEVLGIDLPPSIIDERPFVESISDFKKGTISAIALMVAAPVDIFSGDKSDSIGIVNMNSSELNQILSHLVNLDKVTFSTDIYPYLPNDSIISGVGTWAFLIAHTTLVNKITERENIPFVKTLIEGIVNKSNYIQLKNSYQNGGMFNVLTEGNDFRVIMKTENSALFFRGLPMNVQLEEILGIDKFSWVVYVGMLVFLLLVLYCIFRLIDKTKFYSLWSLWIRYRHIVVGFGIIIISYFGIIYFILYFEEKFYSEYLVRSPVLDLSDKDIFIWLLLLVFADYNGNVFPISSQAQLLVTVSIYFGIVTLGGIAIVEYFIREYNKKRKKGMGKINEQNHYVICGWNEHGKQFLKNAKIAMDSYKSGLTGKIVVISPKIKASIEADDELDLQHNLKHFEFINGEPSEIEMLEKANISKARTVVLLADDDTHASDERTLLRALAIGRFCNKKSHNTIDNIYIIAELNTSKLRSSLLNGDVNEVVCTSELGSEIILQSMFNHGIAKAIEGMLTYNDFNEFYTVNINEYQNLIGFTYDELLPKLRGKGILLLGIKSVYYDEDRMEINDDEIITELMKKDERMRNISNPRQIMVNPVSEGERNFKTDKDDQLLVLAFNGHDIENLKNA